MFYSRFRSRPYNDRQRSSISVVRGFEDETFISSKIFLRDELFNLAINPALRLYNVVDSAFYSLFNIWSINDFRFDIKLQIFVVRVVLFDCYYFFL